MPLNQRLAGLVEPAAPSWRSATPADRLGLYQLAGRVAVRIKRAELARGIGANGRKMAPRKRPRADGATGPVLTPHDRRSRTSRLLDSRATAAGVTLFWHSGAGNAARTAWGSILAFHAAGAGKLPVRDVRLSRRGIGAVRAEAAKWWTARLRERSRRAKVATARETARRDRSPGVVRKAQAALAAKFPFMKKYLRDPKDGF